MINIIYIISAVTLFILLILIKKKEEKINIITTFFVTTMLFTCYNTIVYLILGISKIRIDLISFTIPNFILLALLICRIVKDKQLQKYYISKKDVLAVVIIALIGIVVSIIIFGFPFNIHFVEVDASNHYGMITEFMENGNLQFKYMPGSYVNYGIIFKLFFNPNLKFSGYHLFVVLEIIKLIYSGILIYLALSSFIKKRINYIIALILSIIYMVAYPLNGMLCGFVYLQMAVNIVNTILIIMVHYNDLTKRLRNLILFLLCFGLIFTYYILVPPVYIAIFLYILKDFKHDKLETIKDELKIFLIPCIAGIMFFVVLPILLQPQNFTPSSWMNSQEAHDAYIFVSYFSAFIFFLPFNIYHIVSKIKNKELDFMSLMFIMNILYIVFTIVLMVSGLIARYYVMKSYYMLWLIMLVITGISISNILDKNIEKAYKLLVVLCFFVYVIGMLYCTFIKGPCSFKIFEREKESINSMYNIYRLNRGIALSENFDLVYTQNELKTLEKVTNNFDNDTKIIFLEDGLNWQWLRRILLIKDNNSNVSSGLVLGEEKENELIEKIQTDNDKIYIVCHKNLYTTIYFTSIMDKIDKNFNKIIEEDRLFIYTNKGE